MKVFLSWSPGPPDPRYWKWLNLEGIVVSLVTLKKRGLLRKSLLYGLHSFLDYKGTIFLDSGGYEATMSKPQKLPQSQLEVLYMADWLGVDLVAHYDLPFVGRFSKISEEKKWQLLNQSILNAKITHEWEKSRSPSLQIVYVIQGWNEESIEFCATKLAEFGANYYALGSLYGLPAHIIIERVHLVRRIIGDRPKLHLFAVTRIDAIRELKKCVDSVDSSTAGIAGAMKELILGTGKRRHIDELDSFECNCPVCKRYKGSVTIMGKEGKRNYYNKLRKIHNAYHLLSSIKKALCQ